MDQVDYEALTQKLGEVTLQNKQLRRANINMKCEVKHLRRLIKKMKDEAAKEKSRITATGKREAGPEMVRYKKREKGDTYRPIIKVRKVKNGIPTSIELGGHRYALVHDDHINGRKSQVNN